MKKSISIIITTCLMLGSLALSGLAFAHGTEKHGKTAPADTQMEKLHAMMPIFSQLSANLEAALEKGDTVAADAEGSKILSTLPDLKKSKPHKNIKQRKRFVELATSFEEAITSTVDLAKNGDFAGAKAAFKNAEEICAACHAKFRD